MRERWGTLSVKDHVTDAPLVTEILLFDRLVVPIPKWNDAASMQRWNSQHWKPEQLHECLEIVGIKTDKTDGRALTVSWDHDKEERFRNAMGLAAALATQKRQPDASYYADPFQMTRTLIRDEFRPSLPLGVSKAWTVANFTSAEAFREQIPKDSPSRDMRLAASLSHRFLTPVGKDLNHDMLKRAVELTAKDDFCRKRRDFYAWQENIIENEIDDHKAVEEMEQLLAAYNDATKEAFKDSVAKYVFTLIPIALALGGAALDGSDHARIIAGAAGITELIRFWRYDRKPEIDKGDLDGAAMIHDARKALHLKDSQISGDNEAPN